MKNTGLLLMLAGIYMVINAGSFRDVVLGKAKLGFVKPTGAQLKGGYLGGAR